MAPGFRPLLKDACKRLQLSGRLFRLQPRFRLQTEGRSLVLTGADLAGPSKINPDYVTHSLSSIPAAEPVRPLAASAS